MFPFDRDSTAISPTAHYTGHVWSRNGLSHPELGTLEGRVMFDSLQPLMTVSALAGGPTLEKYLLARHRALDELLVQAIENDGVTQVLEIACGMSARGWRFASRYGSELTYVEADLPDMAARKRDALFRIGTLGDGHRVVDVDALASDGSLSLAAVASDLDPARGLVVITEGLIGYLSTDAMLGLWERIATALSDFSVGIYLSDLPMRGTQTLPLVQAFRVALSVFVRGRVHMHFADEREARLALTGAGFAFAEVVRADSLGVSDRGSRRGSGGDLSRIVCARAR
jgi:O-methyltransferase involved in polyketide biosynthesis